MTNSSKELHHGENWVAALASSSVANEPLVEQPKGWLGALAEPENFVEGFPFDAAQPERGTVRGQDLTSNPDNAPEPDNDIGDSDVVPTEGTEPHDPIAEAFAQGEAKGRADAMAEQAIADEQRRKLQLSLRALDQAGLDALATDLAATVGDLCAQVFAEYAPDPDRLIERCTKAAKKLGSAVSDCALHLNPEDIELLDPDVIDQWKVIADPAMERGGLLFEGPDGAVSDRAEDWRRAVSAAIGA